MTSSSAFVRWGGTAAVGAGLLFVAGALLATLGLNILPPSPGFGLPQRGQALSSDEYAYLALSGSAALLLVGGLLGLRARLADGSGRLGTTGFLLACVGVVLAGALEPAALFVVRANERAVLDAAAVADLAGLLGLFLLGFAALRAGALRQLWGALPLLIASVQVAAGLSNHVLTRYLEPEAFYRVSAVAPTLVGLGWVLVGYALLWSSEPGGGLRGRGEPVG